MTTCKWLPKVTSLSTSFIVNQILDISSDDSIDTSPTTCKWLPNDTFLSTSNSLWTFKLLETSSDDSIDTSQPLVNGYQTKHLCLQAIHCEQSDC